MFLQILREFLLQKPVSDPTTPSTTTAPLPQSIGEEWWERVG
jgi:hypothetical protein